jgi:hypothetical protein
MENYGQMVWNKIIIFIVLSIIPMIVGGWVAYRKKDYIARGVVISLFASWFGPIFMYFQPDSKARQGDTGDEQSWPANGPLACMCFIASILVYYVISQLLEG